MKLPRPRFTVWRLMILVALIAALLGAFEAGRQSERRRILRGRTEAQAFFLGLDAVNRDRVMHTMRAMHGVPAPPSSE